MPSAVVTPAQLRLVEGHRLALGKLRNVTTRNVVATFGRLGRYDDAGLVQFVETVVPRVERAQYTAAQLRANYLARSSRMRVPTLERDRVTGAALRNGADPRDVYARPFRQLWSDLGKGRRFPDALGKATERLRSITDTDVNLASRAASVEVAARSGGRIVRYERVPDGGACPLCLMASTQLYRTGDLQPIHDNCACDVVALDAEQVAAWGNNDGEGGRSDRYYAAKEGVTLEEYVGRTGSGETVLAGTVDRGDGAGAQPVEAAIRTHGEYGPTLTNAADAFRGPDDVAADVAA